MVTPSLDCTIDLIAFAKFTTPELSSQTLAKEVYLFSALKSKTQVANSIMFYPRTIRDTPNGLGTKSSIVRRIPCPFLALAMARQTLDVIAPIFGDTLVSRHSYIYVCGQNVLYVPISKRWLLEHGPAQPLLFLQQSRNHKTAGTVRCSLSYLGSLSKGMEEASITLSSFKGAEGYRCHLCRGEGNGNIPGRDGSRTVFCP